MQQNNLQYHFCFLYLSKLNATQNSYKMYKKFINSKMPNWSCPAQVSDYVIFQNTKPLPMIGEEVVLQSINLVEKRNCKIQQQKILARNLKI